MFGPPIAAKQMRLRRQSVKLTKRLGRAALSHPACHAQVHRLTLKVVPAGF
jgi:hypothetical protein